MPPVWHSWQMKCHQSDMKETSQTCRHFNWNSTLYCNWNPTSLMRMMDAPPVSILHLPQSSSRDSLARLSDEKKLHLCQWFLQSWLTNQHIERNFYIQAYWSYLANIVFCSQDDISESRWIHGPILPSARFQYLLSVLLLNANSYLNLYNLVICRQLK